MKFFFAVTLLASIAIAQLPPGHPTTQSEPQPEAQARNVNPEKVLAELKVIAENIEVSPINTLPVQQNGRIKPLDTLSKESLLFITGSYKKFGLHPVQLFNALMSFEGSPYIELIQVRNVPLRTELGYSPDKRFFSVVDLDSSALAKIAEPLLQKQSENSRLLTEDEKKKIETYQQYMLAKELMSGQLLSVAADYGFVNQQHDQMRGNFQFNQEVQQKLKEYFQSIVKGKELQESTAKELISAVKKQKVPDLFAHAMDKMETEVFYNKVRPFFWASIFCLILGVCFFSPMFKDKVPLKYSILLYLLPIAIIILGLGLRVYITQFAPITNMFGTMIWVSFGIMFFSFILFVRYQKYPIPGIALIATGLFLMLTEQIPLILSPDLDPIVAVLRSNFWLSTHVTTITISYAAFTIAMILGNIGLVRLWIYEDNQKYFTEYSHYAYRMIQLGCFLLSIGIILGGIWADYSWGRFWGWDPKETWALIADLGFLAILHGRFAGWINAFTLLAWSPLAYLLVIMAWYGVNFILAAGLHSYGFSSGGAMMVGVFVTAQVLLLLAGLYKLYQKRIIFSS